MKILSSIFLCLFLLSAGEINAQETAPQEAGNEDILLKDPYLSVLFQRGKHLVYNCIDGHWVCTGKAEFESCKETRTFAIKENTTKLPCAPIRIFQSEQDCVAHQISLVNAQTENRFCLHPNRREIEIVY